MKYLNNSLILLINIYQKTLAVFLGGHCRFYPSCSEYSKEAIEKYGPIKGSFLSIKRICQCQPLSRHHGFDPVEKKGVK